MQIQLGLTKPGVIESLDYDELSDSLAIIAGSQVVISQASNKLSTSHMNYTDAYAHYPASAVADGCNAGPPYS